MKQISDNEIYLLIKYIKSVLWRVAKCLSYIEEARCLKVKLYLWDVQHPFTASHITGIWRRKKIKYGVWEGGLSSSIIRCNVLVSRIDPAVSLCVISDELVMRSEGSGYLLPSTPPLHSFLLPFGPISFQVSSRKHRVSARYYPLLVLGNDLAAEAVTGWQHMYQPKLL